MEPSIKVFFTYYKPATLIKNEIFIPIHTGRSISNNVDKDGNDEESRQVSWLIENMIGDNTGDNISYKNLSYCELTAQYWAWKNYDKISNPSHIGFMHYRRQLILNEKTIRRFKPDIQEMYAIHNKIDDSYFDNIMFNETHLRELTKKYDLITPYLDLKENHIDQFKTLSDSLNLEYKLLDSAVKIIQAENPNMYNSAKNYLNQSTHYGFNIFILKRDLFFQYSEWLFRILELLEKEKNQKARSITNERTIAFVAERLQGIYFYWLITEKGITHKECPLSYIKNTEIKQSINPIYSKKEAIVFNISAQYQKQVAVILASFLKHCSTKDTYDITILTSDINNETKRIISNLTIEGNISIRFFDPQNFISEELPKNSNYPSLVYNKFFLSEIFKSYQYAVFLDSDIIIKDDIAKLTQLDCIKSNPISACRDLSLDYFCELYKNLENYMKKSVVCTKDYNYINTGIMVINIQLFNSLRIKDKLIKCSKELLDPLTAEQDIFNYALCKHNIPIGYIDNRWNVDLHPFSYKNQYPHEHYWPLESYQIFVESLKKPAILHFAGPFKPWIDVNHHMAHEFWRHARESPFYENLMFECRNLNPIRNSVKVMVAVKISRLMNFLLPRFSKRHKLAKTFLRPIKSKPLFKKFTRVYNLQG